MGYLFIKDFFNLNDKCNESTVNCNNMEEKVVFIYDFFNKLAEKKEMMLEIFP
jgi:hypothetical protein